MDKIYKYAKSDLFNIKQSFNDYITELGNSSFPKNDDEIKVAMNFKGTNEEFIDLQNSVSLSKITHFDDVRITEFKPGIHDGKRKIPNEFSHKAMELQTLKKSLAFDAANRPALLWGKTTPLRFKQVYKKYDSSENDMNPLDDVVITIRVFNPRMFESVSKSEVNRKPVFREEFQVLGSQYLTELRDRISCICNKYNFYDVSENPDQELPLKETDPGFFFIADTFYNDTRNPENPDYSETVQNWAKCCRELGCKKFSTKLMQETKFSDLSVCLGFPQLYLHHGSCEHIFVFSYVELLSVHNPLARKEYPVLKSVTVAHTNLCYMCGTREYTFVVLNSKRQLHHPTYLCPLCFQSFHYVDGQRVDDFQAYKINNYQGEKRDDEYEDEEDEAELMDVYILGEDDDRLELAD